MIRRIVIFLIRKRLGLGKMTMFRFSNQKKEAYYWFTDDTLMKVENGAIMPSNVCLNWLLDDKCKVAPLGIIK